MKKTNHLDIETNDDGYEAALYQCGYQEGLSGVRLSDSTRASYWQGLRDGQRDAAQGLSR